MIYTFCFRTVVTKYPCKAGHETELSFEANQKIYNGEGHFDLSSYSYASGAAEHA